MWPLLEDGLRQRDKHLRGWLVISTADGTRVTIGGLNGTGASDVDLKLVMHSTDDLGPYQRLKASFRMNGLENPEEHDVHFDFDKDAIESFVKIPTAAVESQKERGCVAEQHKIYVKNKKRRGLWVLCVCYLCENVQRTGFEEAVVMATSAQKAILMDLAHVREVGEFTFVTRRGTAFQRMLERWEGFTEESARIAARSAPKMDVCTEDVRPRL